MNKDSKIHRTHFRLEQRELAKASEALLAGATQLAQKARSRRKRGDNYDADLFQSWADELRRLAQPVKASAGSVG